MKLLSIHEITGMAFILIAMLFMAIVSVAQATKTNKRPKFTSRCREQQELLGRRVKK
jgi:hypothetical protein